VLLKKNTVNKKLKVLFVSSGNSSAFDIVPFIKAQGDSLNSLGINVQYFSIKGKGIIGYLKEAIRLRRYLRVNPIDIIHAHYSLSGWTAILSFSKKPVVLSLMGDDANGSYIGPGKVYLKSIYLKLLTFMVQPFVKAIISKSKNIEASVFRKDISYLIPNGVNLEQFYYMPKGFRKELGLKKNKKYILFLADKKNRRKNYQLVEDSLCFINRTNIILLAPYPICHDRLVKYFNSADVFVLSSFMEGSPNVIKEAMACNCPIVATDVGDVKWVIGETEGCFISSFEPDDFAEKINCALDFSDKYGRTDGRRRILQLGLDSNTVAKKIISVYKKAIR